MGCLGALACRSVRGGKYLKISGGGQHLAAFCIICLLNMWQTRGQDHLHDERMSLVDESWARTSGVGSASGGHKGFDKVGKVQGSVVE